MNKTSTRQNSIQTNVYRHIKMPKYYKSKTSDTAATVGAHSYYTENILQQFN